MGVSSRDHPTTVYRIASNHARALAASDRSGHLGKHLNTILELIREGAFEFEITDSKGESQQNAVTNGCPVKIVKFFFRPEQDELASALLSFFIVDEKVR